MMKKGKIALVISLISVVAVVVIGLIITVIYNVALKPADFENIIPVSGAGTGYYRYCYQELNEEEKAVYGVILQNIYNQPEKIEVPELANGDLTKVFKAISYDNPDLFNIGLKCKMYKKGFKNYFVPEYAIDYATYQKQLKEATEIASVIIEETKNFTSTYEKEKYVHDYIINHCSYVEPEQSINANTMYGCLVEGKASCEGYSRTFQYIMNKLDIDNRLVTGESADDGVNYTRHMWNIVNIDGGSYFVDLTWDDPKSQDSVLRHSYFNVTTNDILLKHRNIEQTLPLCTDTTFNYFVYEGLYFNVGAGDTFESAVYNAVYSALEKQEKCIEIKLSDGAVMAQAVNSLFNDGIIYGAFSETEIVSSTSSQVYYSSDDKLNVICVYF